MSELKVDKVSPRSGTYVSLNTVGSKNIVINGDMSIAQRGTSTASITSSGYYTVDRFQTNIVSMGTWTQSQSTDVPSGQGFATSLKMDCTTADASPAASDQFYVRTKFEGQNLQYLKYGTSSAESMTLSFWVKCNKATTASVQLQDHDNSKMVTKSYTINSADTWEKKTITFNGNTSNSFTNDNNLSLDVRWWLDSGSDFTSGTPSGDWESNDNTKRNNNNLGLASSTSNYINITGIQLEAGTTASDFEFLPYDMNLQRCLRYYQIIPDGWLFSFSSTQAQIQRGLHPNMRAAPSLSVDGAITIGTGFIAYPQSSAHISGFALSNKIVANLHNFTGLTTTTNPAQTYALTTNNILASAEL